MLITAGGIVDYKGTLTIQNLSTKANDVPNTLV